MEPSDAASIAIFASRLQVQVSDHGTPKSLLHDISFQIPSGHFTAIVGPSGCGKSTLLKCLTGVQPPTGGHLLLGGHPVAAIKNDFPLAIGYLPQYSSAHDNLTIGEILRFGIALRLPRNMDSGRKDRWKGYLSSLAGIDSLLNQPYHTLSGGQRRRAALAEELIGDPPFLFLDELTSGLDPQAELEMMCWLRDLAHERQKTVMIVTHSVANLHLCDSILFLGKGRLLYQGPYAEQPMKMGSSRYPTSSIRAAIFISWMWYRWPDLSFRVLSKSSKRPRMRLPRSLPSCPFQGLQDAFPS